MRYVLVGRISQAVGVSAAVRESFQVRVSRPESIPPKAAHHQLTIERVRIDECKAMLWEGGAIEMDLEKDLGLTGTYTLPVSNPVLPPLIRARAERKGWAGSAYRFLIESTEILLRKKMLAMRETLLFLVWIALWNHRGDSGDSAA